MILDGTEYGLLSLVPANGGRETSLLAQVQPEGAKRSLLMPSVAVYHFWKNGAEISTSSRTTDGVLPDVSGLTKSPPVGSGLSGQ
jgi:hypothetical protein